MFDKSQLMRGTLEGCILQIISIKETYGYEILESLMSFGFKDIGEGTLYPLLLRLEKKNFIESTFKPSPLGPKRKYYTITQEGINTLNEFKVCWREITSSVNQVLKLEGDI